MPFLNKVKVFWPRVEHGCLLHFLTFWNSWLRQQISKKPSLYKVLLSFCWNDEGKQAVKTKAECFKAWRLFLFSSLFLSNMHYWPSVRSIRINIWPNSVFLHFVRLSKSLLCFSWLVMPRDFFARSLRYLTHWSSLRLLLRTYECRLVASLALCLPIRSQTMKERTTPIYATCSSPIMHLICPPKFCIRIIFNLS